MFPLLLGALLAPSSLLAETMTDPSIALVEVMSLPVKVVDAHRRLRTKLAEALAPRGWKVVQAALDGPCTEAGDCARAAARQSGIRYLLRMSGAPNQDDGYDFVLELFPADAGAPRKTAAFCDYCDVDRMAEVAARFVLGLLPGDVPRAGSVTSPPTPTPAPPAPQLTTVPRLEKAPGQAVGWPPWVLVAAGVAAAGYGAWALSKDGEASACQSSAVATSCTRYSSGTIGAVAITGGAVLVVTGVVWSLLLHREPAPQVHGGLSPVTRNGS